MGFGKRIDRTNSPFAVEKPTTFTSNMSLIDIRILVASGIELRSLDREIRVRIPPTPLRNLGKFNDNILNGHAVMSSDGRAVDNNNRDVRLNGFFECGGIAQHYANCASSRGVATEAICSLLFECECNNAYTGCCG